MTTSSKIIFWTPRIIVILFIAFISLFALDVFSEGYNLWQTAQALFMHLIPSFVILLLLWIAWRWELPGGILFIALGFGLVYLFGFREKMLEFLAFGGPPILAGILFIVSSKMRRGK